MHSSRPPPERSDKALRAAIRVLVGDERTRLGNRSPAITDRDKAPAGRAEAAAACAPRRRPRRRDVGFVTFMGYGTPDMRENAWQCQITQSWE